MLQQRPFCSRPWAWALQSQRAGVRGRKAPSRGRGRPPRGFATTKQSQRRCSAQGGCIARRPS
eukprot:4474227-Alexandrium_andersonii.AAC.1